MSLKTVMCCLLMSAAAFAQNKRLWVLRSTGEMAEIDPATFATKQTVKLPTEASKNPASVQVNRVGQILFATPINLPLSADDAAAAHKIWIWNGHESASIDLGVTQKEEKTGSNLAITESAPAAYLSADGTHLYWFANEARRLQREDVDLSTTPTWSAWRTDLSGAAREEIATTKLPDCRCPTGSCEDSCPTTAVWAPDAGVDKFFAITQVVAGQTETLYKSTTLYKENASKWTEQPLADALQRVLDSDASANIIVNAVPDAGCCGWSNQSDDQTFVLANGRKTVIFDEFETYKNPDYDVSFSTANAKLSPDLGRVAMTIATTAETGKPIQLSEQGEANPEESQRIRKALTELPAVEVKSVEDSPKRVAFLPHATLVGWINDKEILIVEDHLLVVYNVDTGARRKSTLGVEDAQHVFLR